MAPFWIRSNSCSSVSNVGNIGTLASVHGQSSVTRNSCVQESLCEVLSIRSSLRSTLQRMTPPSASIFCQYQICREQTATNTAATNDKARIGRKQPDALALGPAPARAVSVEVFVTERDAQ